MAGTSGSTMSFHQLQVPIFDGENYGFQCVKMRTSFFNVLQDTVENGYREPN